MNNIIEAEALKGKEDLNKNTIVDQIKKYKIEI